MDEPISLDYLRDLFDLAREYGVRSIEVGGVSVAFSPVEPPPVVLSAEPPLPPVEKDPAAPHINPLYSNPRLFRGGKAPGWRKNTE